MPIDHNNDISEIKIDESRSLFCESKIDLYAISSASWTRIKRNLNILKKNNPIWSERIFFGSSTFFFGLVISNIKAIFTAIDNFSGSKVIITNDSLWLGAALILLIIAIISFCFWREANKQMKASLDSVILDLEESIQKPKES